jgi:DNA-binding NtrC family response regulator
VPVGDEQRFLLRTLDGRPFALNGQWAREAFVEDRDVVAADGPGRLEFRAQRLSADLEESFRPEALRDPALMTSRLPVLLEGETGTGKSHLARAIHSLSGRRGDFVAVNVQSFPAGLVESELFGHRRGSFTGALTDRAGAITQANGGTLFLDEVDSLPRELQTKLLLFLDDQRYRPLGDVGERTADVRLVFASGRPLRKLVALGEMRADFYFRLHQGVRVTLAPLRDQPEEVRRHCQAWGVTRDAVVSERLRDFYMTLPWPGNLRQLYGHLEAKRVRTKGRRLDFDGTDDELLAMTSDLTGLGAWVGDVRPMDDVKRDYAKWAVTRCEGRVGLAAQRLDVHEKTLRSWLAG